MFDSNADCLLYVVERTRASIAGARPLIAAFADRPEFRPEGGKGL